MTRFERAVAAAEALAWLPMSNLPGGAVAYGLRREAHARLVATMPRRLPAHASIATGYLLRAMRRAAAATYSNRMGKPYNERRQAIAELRGCLVVYRRDNST